MTRPSRRSSRRSQRGVALVAVLWGVLLLSVLAVSFATRAGTDARLARNDLDRAEATNLADAGVYWAVRELLRPAEGRRIAVDGSTYAIAFRGVQLHIEVQDEGGKIDLNAAAPELIRGVLVAAGADATSAEQIAAAIADWRDSDDQRRPDGAETADYVAAGLATAPRNSAFLLLGELRAVFGMTPDLFAAATPLLTVNSGAAGIDPMLAPTPVLLALPGMTRTQASDLAGSRRTAMDAAGLLTGAATAFLVGSTGKVHAIRVAVEAPSGARFVRRAVVQLTGQPQRPYRFLQWGEG